MRLRSVRVRGVRVRLVRVRCVRVRSVRVRSVMFDARFHGGCCIQISQVDSMTINGDGYAST